MIVTGCRPSVVSYLARKWAGTTQLGLDSRAMPDYRNERRYIAGSVAIRDIPQAPNGPVRQSGDYDMDQQNGT